MREIGTSRIEAFSDGVFAIAATLLVLEIGVGAKSGAALGNFPQAFTHIGLISAALAIERRRKEDAEIETTAAHQRIEVKQ